MYRVYGEKCCGQKSPFGLTEKVPVFSWRLESDGYGVYQEAFELTVWDQDGRVMWKSGLQKGNNVHNIPYAGEALSSLTDYLWQVRSFGNSKEKASGDICRFTTGIMDPSEWKASWIEADYERRPCEDDTESWKLFAGKMPYLEKPEEKLNPCLYFRREVRLHKRVVRAMASATAHGIYALFINGREYGLPLAPGYTAYDGYQECQLYDVTEAFAPGDNVIGAIVADGWYTGKVGLMGVGNQYGETTAFLMQITLFYEDGTEDIIVTDREFAAGTGAYLYADLFVGEGYDAGREPVGWQRPGYHNSAWKPVLVKDYGYKQLKGIADEPAAYVRIQPLKSILTSPKGEILLDAGENIAGFISVRGQAEKGDVIRMECSEVLDKDGNFLQNIIGQNKNQTDVYIAGEDGPFVYRPRFTFHGFQYVRLTGMEDVKPEQFQVYVLASDLERTGWFTCSDERLNRLQSNIFRSQQGNMLYVPTDCPQREKAGWTGDMQAYTPTAAFLMDVEAFLSKWLQNMRLEQYEDGQVPHVIPDMMSGRYVSAGLSSCGWADACVIVPYRMYQVYADQKILKDNYDMMQRWMAYVEKTAATEFPEGYEQMEPDRKEWQKYLWNTGFHFGDWLIPSLSRGGISDPMTGANLTKEPVATAMFAYTTGLMARISEILGDLRQKEHYELLNARIRDAFAREYLLENGRLKVEFQGIYVLALQMNLVPESARSGLLDRLVEMIEENGGCLDTGFLSMPFLLDVLYDNGRSDAAWKLLFQEKCPSWLYEVKMGANTIWESWTNIAQDGTKNSSSYNHFAFGCVGDFMYRRILGIGRQAPGYSRILIEPDITCGLTFAQGSYESIWGKIAVSWRICDKTVSADILVPPGTNALIRIGSYSEEVLSGQYHYEIQI